MLSAILFPEGGAVSHSPEAGLCPLHSCPPVILDL